MPVRLAGQTGSKKGTADLYGRWLFVAFGEDTKSRKNIKGDLFRRSPYNHDQLQGESVHE